MPLGPCLAAPPILSEALSPTPNAHAPADQHDCTRLEPTPCFSWVRPKGGNQNSQWRRQAAAGCSHQSQVLAIIPRPNFPTFGPHHAFPSSLSNILVIRTLAAASPRSTNLSLCSRNYSLALPFRLDMSRQPLWLLFMPLTTRRPGALVALQTCGCDSPYQKSRMQQGYASLHDSHPLFPMRDPTTMLHQQVTPSLTP